MENKLDELIKEIKRLASIVDRLERKIISPVNTGSYTGFPLPRTDWPDIQPNITMGER